MGGAAAAWPESTGDTNDSSVAVSSESSDISEVSLAAGDWDGVEGGPICTRARWPVVTTPSEGGKELRRPNHRAHMPAVSDGATSMLEGSPEEAAGPELVGIVVDCSMSGTGTLFSGPSVPLMDQSS